MLSLLLNEPILHLFKELFEKQNCRFFDRIRVRFNMAKIFAELD